MRITFLCLLVKRIIIHCYQYLYIMNNKIDYKTYTDFLGDECFIKWQFLKDEKLNEYWNSFIKENPELQDEFDKACSFISKIGIRKNILPEADKNQLLKTIKYDVKRFKQKKRKRIYLSVTAVAYLILVFLIIPWQNKFFLPMEEKRTVTVETSVLSPEDIYIITPSGSVPLKNNADIHMQRDNTALVNDADGENKILELDGNHLNKIIVPYGKRSKMTLSDGTKIWLNSGSTLEFPSKFTGTTREINLTGEIYIDVVHGDAPFIVHAEKFDVKVYGTKFNITAYSNSENFVVLESGSVSVKSKSKEELHIEPREMVTFKNDGRTIKTKNVNISEFTSWKDGYLELNRTSMLDVLKRIERYYNLSFSYSDKDYNSLKNKTCTGRIILTENSANVLTTFALLSAAKFEEDNQRILIDVEP